MGGDLLQRVDPPHVEQPRSVRRSCPRRAAQPSAHERLHLRLLPASCRRDPRRRFPGHRDWMGQALRQCRRHLPSPQGGEGHPSHDQRTATPSTASSEMVSSALTPLEAVDPATVTLVAPWSRRLVARPLETSGPRSELSPSEHLLDVRLACPPDSPGPSTTWTGSSPRLECLEEMY